MGSYHNLGWLLLVVKVGQSDARSLYGLFVNVVDLVDEFSGVGDADHLDFWIAPVDSEG